MCRKSERFLRDIHPEGSIPIPTEEIAEIKWGLDIIPLPGLRDLLEVDGFISSDEALNPSHVQAARSGQS